MTVLLALGMTWLGPPPMTGTPRWQWTAPQPPAIAPLVPAPGRDQPSPLGGAVSRPQRSLQDGR